MNIAQGTFEIQFQPQTSNLESADHQFGRLTFNKAFSGSLSGPSKGEMLSCKSSVDGSAGYVALEMFEGILDGRSGSFVLQHSSTLDRGAPQQAIMVVPDSGTGQLSGLSGRLEINIVEGKHLYTFHYNFL